MDGASSADNADGAALIPYFAAATVRLIGTVICFCLAFDVTTSDAVNDPFPTDAPCRLIGTTSFAFG